MIRWNLDPQIITWTTDREYRVVDRSPDGLLLAQCDTRAEAETARDLLRSYAAVVGVPHGDVTREMIERATREELLAGTRFTVQPSERVLAEAANGRFVPAGASAEAGAADLELAPANDLCFGCGADRAGDRCSAGCGWGLSLLPAPTPVERALLDIAAALGIDAGLGGWLERTVAAASALGRATAEGLPAPAEAAPIPLVIAGPPWVPPEPGEVFEGRVRRGGTLDGCWYRMEWRGWYDYEGGHRASVRLIDPGPQLGDTLAEMRPLGRTSGGG